MRLTGQQDMVAPGDRSHGSKVPFHIGLQRLNNRAVVETSIADTTIGGRIVTFVARSWEQSEHGGELGRLLWRKFPIIRNRVLWLPAVVSYQNLPKANITLMVGPNLPKEIGAIVFNNPPYSLGWGCNVIQRVQKWESLTGILPGKLLEPIPCQRRL